MIELDREIAEAIDDDELFRLAEGGEHEFSPKYNDAMEKMFRKARAHPKRRMQPIRRIIAVAAIIAALSGTVAAAAFWEEIWQFIVVSFGQYVELRVEEHETHLEPDFTMIPQEWGSFWCPELKNGYSITSAKSSGAQKILIFQNQDEILKLYQWNDDRSINADNESLRVSGVLVDGKEVYAIEKKEYGLTYRMIFWTIDNTSFELRGTLTFEELTEIANSLIFVEK